MRVGSGGVLYRLDPRLFTARGTLDAAVEHLDPLADLGVDTVELAPLSRAATCAPDPAGLARFVDACHARAIGVVLHVRYDHLDPDAENAQRGVVASVVHWLREHQLNGLRVELGVSPADPAAGPDPSRAARGGYTRAAPDRRDPAAHRPGGPRGHRTLTDGTAGLLTDGTAGLTDGTSGLLAGGAAGGATTGWSRSSMADLRAPLDWGALDQPQHREILALYRRLIALRRREPALGAALAPDHVRQGHQSLAVRRGDHVVVANLGPTRRRVTIAGVPCRVLVATEPGVSLTHDAVDLPARSAAVVGARRFDRAN